MLDHLRHRAARRFQRQGVSGFERRALAHLNELARRLHLLTPEFRIAIVQPGLSRVQANANSLELLASTELHLQETYASPLSVITSP